jgi:hypothetical protein
MPQQSWLRSTVALGILFLAFGCAPQETAVPTATGQEQQAIPADSPLAKIRVGMSQAEMFSLIGPPTDQETSLTGKAFIPLYFGGDQSATRMHYKGLGRVFVSGQGAFGGGGKVLKIEYDPQEPGFRR